MPPTPGIVIFRRGQRTRVVTRAAQAIDHIAPLHAIEEEILRSVGIRLFYLLCRAVLVARQQ